MKLLSILLPLFLVARSSHATTVRTPKSLAVEDDIHTRLLARTNPDQAFLASETCQPFMEAFGRKMDRIFTYVDETIVNFVCNPMERSVMKDAEERLEEDVVRRGRDRQLDDSQDIEDCSLAYERVLLDHERKLDQTLRSGKACKKEMRWELRKAHEQRRLLMEEGDLLLLGLLYVGPLLILSALISPIAEAGVYVGAAGIAFGCYFTDFFEWNDHCKQSNEP